MVISILLHSGVGFYVHRLNENNEFMIQTCKELHRHSDGVISDSCVIFMYTGTAKTMHS
jgi:hypothetical protein